MLFLETILLLFLALVWTIFLKILIAYQTENHTVLDVESGG